MPDNGSWLVPFHPKSGKGQLGKRLQFGVDYLDCIDMWFVEGHRYTDIHMRYHSPPMPLARCILSVEFFASIFQSTGRLWPLNFTPIVESLQCFGHLHFYPCLSSMLSISIANICEYMLSTCSASLRNCCCCCCGVVVLPHCVAHLAHPPGSWKTSPLGFEMTNCRGKDIGPPWLDV